LSTGQAFFGTTFVNRWMESFAAILREIADHPVLHPSTENVFVLMSKLPLAAGKLREKHFFTPNRILKKKKVKK